jgi:two-component system nitrate/nitrite response regulator NarL
MSRALSTLAIAASTDGSTDASLSTIVGPPRASEVAPAASAPTETLVRVLVVDDHPFFRDGVTRSLTESGRVDVIGEAENGSEGLEMIRRDPPDVALVDYQMPVMDGLDLVHAVVDEDLPTRVVLLSAVAESAVVFRALEEGAAGYLSKDARRKEIVDAVLRAAEGQTVLPSELAGALAGEIRHRAHDQARAVSDTELEILRAFSKGLSVPQVAAELNLGVSTVRTNAQHLFEKLGVSDRAAAVAEAMRRGLLN